jgi:NADH dehydrogenase/NADH:ubiquinone oxidoreductase subunit G
VYTFLTDNNYDDHSYDFVLKSIQIDKPDLTYKKFIKDYAYRKTGNINSINNKNIGDRLSSRLSKDIGVLQGRHDRLDEMKTNLTKEGSENSAWDIERMLDTTRTTEQNIKNKIKDQRKVLSRKVTGAEYQTAKANIASLNSELDSVVSSNKALRKRFNALESHYSSMSEYDLKKAYKALISDIQKDIVKNQQSVVIEQAFKSSASFPAKTFAQTEYVDAVTKTDVLKLEEEQDKLGKPLLVKWTLSASHTIVDICDDHADKNNGYGKGVYELDKAPRPISDSHPNCKCSLVKV